MNEIIITWPDDFEEYSWLLESKGYFCGVRVEVGGVALFPAFYDKVRLFQGIEDESADSGIFCENFLVVIDAVNKDKICAAIQNMAEEGVLKKWAGR